MKREDLIPGCRYKRGDLEVTYLGSSNFLGGVAIVWPENEETAIHYWRFEGNEAINTCGPLAVDGTIGLILDTFLQCYKPCYEKNN